MDSVYGREKYAVLDTPDRNGSSGIAPISVGKHTSPDYGVTGSSISQGIHLPVSFAVGGGNGPF